VNCPMKIVFFGLSITSSWGNGHATTYRSLLRALAARGHELLFLERDQPWYAGNRDLPSPEYARTELYTSLSELKERFTAEIRDADAVVVGSYVPDGIAVGTWVTREARGIRAFYDIDTPATLAMLEGRTADTNAIPYLSAELIPRFDLYLSFTGGPILSKLEKNYRARMARPLYCSVDMEHYYPEKHPIAWDIGYLGTYSDDRQPALDRMLVSLARRWTNGRFVVAGPQYPANLSWADNIDRIAHLAPAEHRKFYNSQRFTINVTRKDMVKAGFSPSVRLFEAAACGTPIISDDWPGLGTFFLSSGSDMEILVAKDSTDVHRFVTSIPEQNRIAIGQRARARVAREHSSSRRAIQFESFLNEVLTARP